MPSGKKFASPPPKVQIHGFFVILKKFFRSIQKKSGARLSDKQYLEGLFWRNIKRETHLFTKYVWCSVLRNLTTLTKNKPLRKTTVIRLTHHMLVCFLEN